MTRWRHRRRERDVMAATLDASGEELEGASVHIRCLACTEGVLDYNGLYPLSANYVLWGKVHGGHPVEVDIAGEHLGPVLLPH